MESVQQYFSWLDAHQVICLLDTCYSGAAGGRSFERDSFQVRALLSDEFLDALASEGRVVITACAANEVSIESPQKEHGLFTYYLVKGLQGEADTDGDGRVTVDELYDFVYQHVDRDARLLHGRMSPIRKGSVRGRVYLTEYRSEIRDEKASSAASPSAQPLQTLNPARTDTPSHVEPPEQNRRNWMVMIVGGLAVSIAAVVAGFWFSIAHVPSTHQAVSPPASSGTGRVAFEWRGSSSVEWSVVDADDKTIQQGSVGAKSTTSVPMRVGTFFVVIKSFPELGRLPVQVTADATSTVTPSIGQIEMMWNGTNSVTAQVRDGNERVVRENWKIAPKERSVVDLPSGQYSILVPNAPARAVTVAVGETAKVSLRPEAPPPPSPLSPSFAAPWKLANTPLFGFSEIPGGMFLMGSDNKHDPNAAPDEQPQHQVNLNAFFIGRYEVTVDQYKACIDDRGCEVGDPKAVVGSVNLPVRYVSWLEAVKYCEWLDSKLRSSPNTPDKLAAALRGIRDGRQWQVRLPTEAEWERAARGTDGRIYPWGDQIDPSRANFNGAKLGGPTPVGSYPKGANEFGLLDMSGNVWEWTRSRPNNYPYRPNDGREEMRTSKAVPRVIRGGSFQTTDVRAARRNFGMETERTNFTGFRLVVAPPP
jgi:formylglycine-generating enzyme required for sulfatase activity